MIDLSNFCGDEDSNFRLASPFNQGEWTYATNGHVIVRIPLLAGLREDGPNAAVTFDIHTKNTDTPSIVFTVELPSAETRSEECSDCDGTGTEHDCPACNCKCDECGGSGKFETCSDKSISVSIGGVPFASEYIRLIAMLPEVVIAPPKQKKALRFSFNGGEGLLMPLTTARDTNVDADLTA